MHNFVQLTHELIGNCSVQNKQTNKPKRIHKTTKQDYIF